MAQDCTGNPRQRDEAADTACVNPAPAETPHGREVSANDPSRYAAAHDGSLQHLVTERGGATGGGARVGAVLYASYCPVLRQRPRSDELFCRVGEPAGMPGTAGLLPGSVSSHPHAGGEVEEGPEG